MTKYTIIYRQKRNNLDDRDSLIGAYIVYKSLIVSDNLTLYDFEIIAAQDREKNIEVGESENIFVIGVDLLNKNLQKMIKEKKNVYIYEIRENQAERVQKIAAKITELNYAPNLCCAYFLYQKRIAANKIPNWLKYIQDIESQQFKLSKSKIVDAALETYLADLQSFGAAKYHMVFTWFDFLDQLNRNDLLNYLEETGKGYLAYKEEVRSNEIILDSTENIDPKKIIKKLRDRRTEEKEEGKSRRDRKTEKKKEGKSRRDRRTEEKEESKSKRNRKIKSRNSSND